MFVRYKDYVLEQDVTEPGVWVSREGKRFMHILLDHPLTEQGLIETMDELDQCMEKQGYSLFGTKQACEGSAFHGEQ